MWPPWKFIFEWNQNYARLKQPILSGQAVRPHSSNSTAARENAGNLLQIHWPWRKSAENWPVPKQSCCKKLLSLPAIQTSVFQIKIHSVRFNLRTFRIFLRPCVAKPKRKKNPHKFKQHSSHDSAIGENRPWPTVIFLLFFRIWLRTSGKSIWKYQSTSKRARLESFQWTPGENQLIKNLHPLGKRISNW